MAVGCACGRLQISGEPDVMNDFIEDSSPDLDDDPTPDPASDSADVDDAAEELPDNCGNAIIDPGEECDDGDGDDCNGCSNECEWEQAMRIWGRTPGALVSEWRSLCVSCPFAIEGWFRAEAWYSHASMLYIPGFVDVQVNRESHLLEFDFGERATCTSPYVVGSLAVGSWHHLALICTIMSSSFLMVFIDGQLTQAFYIPDDWTCDGPVHIGNRSELEESAHLTLDDIRISNSIVYGRAGDAGDFTPASYLDVRPDTLALWRFNTEVEGIVEDASGHGHDAELVEGDLVPDDCRLP